MTKTKWEYQLIGCMLGSGAETFDRELRESIEDSLNDLGSEGWELVDIVDHAHGAVRIAQLFFKRPKE